MYFIISLNNQRFLFLIDVYIIADTDIHFYHFEVKEKGSDLDLKFMHK